MSTIDVVGRCQAPGVPDWLSERQAMGVMLADGVAAMTIAHGLAHADLLADGTLAGLVRSALRDAADAGVGASCPS